MLCWLLVRARLDIGYPGESAHHIPQDKFNRNFKGHGKQVCGILWVE